MRRFREIPNVNLGTLNASKNGHIVRYDVSTNQYSLVDPDAMLSTASDGIPTDFIRQIETQIDTNNMDIGGVDGGSF